MLSSLFRNKLFAFTHPNTLTAISWIFYGVSVWLPLSHFACVRGSLICNINEIRIANTHSDLQWHPANENTPKATLFTVAPSVLPHPPPPLQTKRITNDATLTKSTYEYCFSFGFQLEKSITCFNLKHFRAPNVSAIARKQNMARKREEKKNPSTQAEIFDEAVCL